MYVKCNGRVVVSCPGAQSLSYVHIPLIFNKQFVQWPYFVCCFSKNIDIFFLSFGAMLLY